MIQKDRLTYLASPYSHSLQSIVDERARLAQVCARKLMERGYCIYSPIAYTHGIDRLGPSLPYDYWMLLDRQFLLASHSLLILDIAGWHASRGVEIEVRTAKGLGLPIFFVNPVGRIYNAPSLLTLFTKE